jgi:hypothetical protein
MFLGLFIFFFMVTVVIAAILWDDWRRFTAINGEINEFALSLRTHDPKDRSQLPRWL